MGTMGLFHIVRTLSFCVLLRTCMTTNQHIGQINPGFQGSQLDWMDSNGLFLLSNNSMFAFGFYRTLNVTLFVLVILHLVSGHSVWTANRGGLLVTSSDKLVFEKSGDVYLEGGDGKVWRTNTAGLGVSAMELQDSGNLVLLGDNRRILWQSFSYPTDTLLSGQEFLEGMALESFPSSDYLSNYLEMGTGDLVLYAGFRTPQPYWSMSSESRKTVDKVGGKVYSASLVSNSWNFYDQNQSLIWKFIFTENSDPNATWAAILGTDGSILFRNLQKGNSGRTEETKIPQNSCTLPGSCDPYYVCVINEECKLPLPLRSLDYKSLTNPHCNSSNSSVELLYIGEDLNYFTLGFSAPFLKESNLDECKEACLHNCSCLVLFYSSGGSCYLFDQIGSLQQSDLNSRGFSSYVKVSTNGDGLSPSNKKGRNDKKQVLLIVFIAVSAVLVLAGLLFLGFWCYEPQKTVLESSQDTLEDDTLMDSLPGMPVRFSYDDLCNATNNFSVKLGQGGFGSVYQGVLPDGTRVAVKKLEGIGQGNKEFKAEVITIGSIYHVHLVKLKGFCVKGVHKLLVYEYMGNGSLDRWIFDKKKEGLMLDWERRFNIALGMAKGLAYLHEECDVKIIHCDIKPENVLLDDNFHVKVADFGLAKLMNREDSHVFTALRGTRGYLAPEWIRNSAISEKSDVYSFGVVLLEIVAGRRCYSLEHNSEMAPLPTYALKMMEEGKVKEILDLKMKIDENDVRVTTVVKVALWCIQTEMCLRPPMTKVVQMLEGLSAVPNPPTSSHMGSHIASFFKWTSEEDILSPSIVNDSDALLSATRLSGPR